MDGIVSASVVLAVSAHVGVMLEARRFREPFLVSARVLLAEGVNAATELTMCHEGSDETYQRFPKRAAPVSLTRAWVEIQRAPDSRTVIWKNPPCTIRTRGKTLRRPPTP